MGYFVFILGLIIGGVIVRILDIRQTSTGTLLIDHSNPEKDIYQININNLDDLSKKKRVVLKVDNYATLTDISQK